MVLQLQKRPELVVPQLINHEVLSNMSNTSLFCLVQIPMTFLLGMFGISKKVNTKAITNTCGFSRFNPAKNAIVLRMF